MVVPVLLRCMWLLGVVLDRTASPLAVGCGCNEHGSLGAAVNRSFLPETNENVLQKIRASQPFGKSFVLHSVMSAGRDAAFHTLCSPV